jgi:hypothetical protein
VITADTHNRVANWSRAHRWFRSRGRSFSLEGRFRCSRGVEVEYENGDPPPKSPQPIDLFDAWRVELAWRMLQRNERWVIKFHYHARATMTPELACRLMKRMRPPIYVHVLHWDRERLDALLALQAALERSLHGRWLHSALVIVLDVPIDSDYKVDQLMLAD